MGISIIGAAPPAGPKEKRVQLFTATGSWTAPTGVTYAIAHLVGGGGGGGTHVDSVESTNGSASSALGISANGGRRGSRSNDFSVQRAGGDGLANTGTGGGGCTTRVDFGGAAGDGADGQLLLAGAVVIPGTSYTITVGAGGTGAVGGNGGSGYVAIEFYV